MPPILTVQDLRVHYKTEAGLVHAVNGITFDLQSGEALTIVGESGAGKTVAMLALLKLIDPPGEIISGRVIFDGQDLLQCSPSELQQVRGRRIALIQQDPQAALNPVLPIGLQVSEALTVHRKLSKTEERAQTLDLLEKVGIPDSVRQLDRYAHQLSGGMAQRVMIAIALAAQPEILIADEPTSALDVTVQAEIIDLLLGLQKDIGMAMIWITHDLGVVARVAQRVLVMYAGMIMEESQVEELFRAPRHPYTIGLLNARPRMDGAPGRRLYNIPGQPLELLEEPKGCPFAPRCRYASGRCRLEMPPMFEVSETHHSACWEYRRFGS
jgi:oligopeptide/dipeptide ABC transporter ATP-binding protein